MKILDVFEKKPRLWEILFESAACIGIDIYARQNLDPGLFKTRACSATTAKEIYGMHFGNQHLH